MRLTNANAKTSLLWNNITILLSITILCLPKSTWALSDKRLCADPQCKEIISIGTTKISYAAPEKGMLSFKINSPVRVLSKGAGNDKKLWGVEINGRRGYVSKDFIMETRILKAEKLLAFEVPVDDPNKPADKAPAASVTQTQKTMEQQGETVAANTQKQETVTPAVAKPLEQPVVSSVPTVAKLAEQPVVAAPQKQQVAASVPEIAKPLDQREANAGPTVTKLPEEPQEQQPAVEASQEKQAAESMPAIAKPLEQPAVSSVPTVAKLAEKPVVEAPHEQRVAASMPAIANPQEPRAANAVPTVTKLPKESQQKLAAESMPAIAQPLEQPVVNAVPKLPKEPVFDEFIHEEKQEAEAMPAIAKSLEQPTLTNAEQTEAKLAAQPMADATVLPIPQEQRAAPAMPAIAKPLVVDRPNERAVYKEAMLNASESTDDTVATTTTSPLDVEIKSDMPVILTEQDTLRSNEIPTPTVHKAQFVDGTELPLEAEPATVEPIEYETEQLPNETNIDENEHTEDFDDNEYEEDDASLDSEENEVLYRMASEKVMVKQGQPMEKQATEDERQASNKLAAQPVADATVLPIPQGQVQPALAHAEPAVVDKPNERAVYKEAMLNASELTVATTLGAAEGQGNVNVQQTVEDKPAVVLSETAEVVSEFVDVVSETAEVVKPAEVLTATTLNNTENIAITTENTKNEQHATVTESPSEKAAQAVPTPVSMAGVQLPATAEAEVVLPEQQQQPATQTTAHIPEAQQLQANATQAAATAENAAEPVALTAADSESYTTSSEQVPSLPPLIFKQQINNPNEYYKQLEQLQQQAAAAAQKETKLPEPYAYVNEPEHTTVAYDSPYDTFDAAEVTAVPPAQAAPQEQVAEAATVQQAVVDTTTGAETVMPAETAEPVALPSTAEAIKDDDGLGLFATIVGTVNSFISSQKKEPETTLLTGSAELQRILYPDADGQAPAEYGHCARPEALLPENCHASVSLDNFMELLAAQLVQHSQLLLCVVIAAAASFCFMCVYYCCCNNSQESALLAKLNVLERSLLAAHKETLIVKHELTTTRNKLSSIEDNSFGSNDMVAALKRELETELCEKAQLQQQVSSLEKDLDNAAEAGLELNKMLSEVLSNQSGEDAFMSTVEQLQRQLDDQEKIIVDINSSLAEKSRENSELQYSFNESNARLTREMQALQQDNYELEMEKSKLKTRVDEVAAEAEQALAKALETRNYEMQRLQKQILELTGKWEQQHDELQTSLAKIEALEDCLKTVNKSGNINVQELIATTKTRGELNAAQNKYLALQEKLEKQTEAKSRLEHQLESVIADVEKLKQEFNHSERDKLEAQTRLEVLSSYFRDKESQLQKELSQQEAKWLQHQGENASTVETQTLMKNEIQALKSQNDELRAEIEAQIASHKAQMGTLENRAHESWLAARQFERRSEEALTEAAALRRKLTAIASGSAAPGQLPNGGADAVLGGEPKGPSPLPQPGSPLLSMPNHLPFLAPFMGLPPPFLPPAAGVARPPPLGRMRSPPPPLRGERYHQQRDDYSDYDDYDDDDDDERGMDRHRRHSGNWGRRDSSLQSPRTYRSLSPSDSRYNYNDTETDFSPPPSPSPPRNGSSRPKNEV